MPTQNGEFKAKNTFGQIRKNGNYFSLAIVYLIRSIVKQLPLPWPCLQTPPHTNLPETAFVPVYREWSRSLEEMGSSHENEVQISTSFWV